MLSVISPPKSTANFLPINLNDRANSWSSRSPSGKIHDSPTKAIEFENLKDLNLKLITQFHLENSPANIEKIAKESLGMQKRRPKEISNEK